MSRLDSYTSAHLSEYLRQRGNTGRWGEHDELGTLNLITPQKRLEAASLVVAGETLSLSRRLQTRKTPSNPAPLEQRIRTDAFGAHEFIGLEYHGFSTTHIDALSHSWGPDGMYNGKDPNEVFSAVGAEDAKTTGWGGIDRWNAGIITRGVLVDVPGFRGKKYVSSGEPLGKDELEAICVAQGLTIGPGDAVLIYSGRDSYDEEEIVPWGHAMPDEIDGLPAPRPGLHPSSVEFLREHDVSVLVWDMLEEGPYGQSFDVHTAIAALGLAIVDNADLGNLARTCRARNRRDFMLIVAPLAIPGGTGSPVTPLALL